MLLFESTVIAGIVIGFGFALAALGITLIYRVTGVVNFAHGAMGMYSTFVAWWFLYNIHPLTGPGVDPFTDTRSILLGVAIALIFSLVLGFALENLIFRWLRGRPQLVKAVITVGVLLALQAAASIQFGSTQYHAALKLFDPSRCGGRCFTVSIGQLAIGYDQLLVIIVALALAGALAVFLRFSRFGIAMRAVSDDPVAASLYGIPVNLVGSVSWMLGSLIAAIAGLLLISVGAATFDTLSLTVLIIDALAAALIGGMVSLPLTIVGGLVLGLLEALPRIWINSTGLPKVVAIGVILIVLMIRTEKNLLRSTSE